MKTRIVLSVVVVFVASLAVMTAAYRGSAHSRCEGALLPLFPTRVVEIAVDWQILPPGYDCVYRTYHGGEIRLP